MTRLALLNVRRHARRVAGLVILIVVGTTAGMVAIGIADTASRAASDKVVEGEQLRMIELSSLGSRDDVRSLIPASMDEVKRIPGVVSVEPVLQTGIGLADSRLPAVMLYATSHRPSLTPPITKTEEGRTEAFPLAAGEVILPSRAEGQELTSALGRSISVDLTQRVGPDTGQLVTKSLRVVGLYDVSWQIDGPGAAYVSDATAAEWAGLRSGAGAGQTTTVGYREVTVVVDRSQNVGRVTKDLQRAGFAATSMQQRLRELPGTVKLIRLTGWTLLGAVVLIATLAAGSLANSLVRQRVREIGLLKAIGYRRRDVFALFGLEMGIVALLSASVGAALGVVGSLGVGEILKHREAFQVSLGEGAVLPSLTLGSVVAMLPCLAVASASLFPALRAAAVPPSEALREWR